jgi:predicted extracellular nuclease
MSFRRTTHRTAVAGLIGAFLLSIIPALPVAADTTPQSLPFSQSWTNIGLITVDDNWNGVPGIVGYRGDNIAGIGSDPRQITVDSGVVDVNANQTSPNTFTTGGVAEFHITDPVVALQGSGTADAPYIEFRVNTTGLTNIHVALNLRDIDGSADNAFQQVAVQFRGGTSGGWNNPASGAYVDDATEGPSLAGKVTPISTTLSNATANADNQAVVGIRVITTDAPGSDEWVGVDDIVVSGSPIVEDQAPTVTSTTPDNNATDVALDANLSVAFSEAVTVSDASFTLSCADSGQHALARSGGPATYTLNPDPDFTSGEACTFTVVANEVSDVDTSDPPDKMAGNLVVGFTAHVVVVAPPDVNVSQVYGGGGNAGATYRNDFIELYNPGSSPVSLAGWSVQYAAAAGTSWQVTPLTGSIPAGSHYLVQEAAGAGGIISLPTPDATGTIAMAAGSGKVALVSTTTALAGSCPTGGAIIDFVGYGTANCFEGSGAAPLLTNTTAALRAGDGATDTDNNAADFASGAPAPRPVIDPAPAVQSTTPANGTTGVGLASSITISFTEPVAVTGDWFTISCPTSGPHAAAVTDGPITFTLNPATDFGDNESCTVTVKATQVTDLDAQDPPDPMAADYAFTFTSADVELCGDPVTPIHEIQGSGPASPLVGQSRAIEGVVVGDYQLGSEFEGFHVQDEDADADADPATSEGIFVFDDGFGVDVAPGDHVRVRGTVAEFNGLTELNGVSLVIVCSTGNTVTPASVSFPVAAVADLERYEGMLVHVGQTMTATEVFNLGRFGEVSLSGTGRLYTPTAVASPGPAALARLDLNNRSRIILDDGNNLQNIDPTRYPAGGLSASNTLRVGDTLPDLTGVLESRFGNYRIQPVGPISFAATNPRTPAPAPVGGTVKVASFNVLNFFNGDGLGGGFPTARGANSAFELGRQKAKIVSALTAIDADIVGLMEIENDATPNSAIEELVAGLNAATAPGTYAFIDTGVVGTDEIRVAMIYKPAHVTPVGPYALLTSAVDSDFIDTLNRPSLAQTFERNATGARLTVVVNHLKSKGSDCNAVGDPDTGDGQGNCNVTRTKAAQALVDWLATDPTASGDPDFLIIGDLNSYAFEDPITAITGAGFTNLVDDFVGGNAYSYVFNGESGYLDHGLATASLAGQVTGAVDWHINPDEPTVLDYNTEFKTPGQVVSFFDPGPYRASDHDPVVIGLDLDASPTVDAGGPYSVVEGGSVTVTATGTEPDGQPLTYAWDLDGNGSFETVGQSVSVSAGGRQAPSSFTIRVRATDPDGLFGTDTATVNVIWAFGGFRSPLNGSIVNVTNAGSTIPVKFSLGGNQGLSIFKAGYPASAAYDCGTVPPTTASLKAQTSTPFRYDGSTDEYVFEWKTDKAWEGTCRVLVLGLADGTTWSVEVLFKSTTLTPVKGRGSSASNAVAPPPAGNPKPAGSGQGGSAGAATPPPDSTLPTGGGRGGSGAAPSP